MIKAVFYKQRSDGVRLYRKYSDSGFYLEKDGEKYRFAIEAGQFETQFTESDEKIPFEDEEEATEVEIPDDAPIQN